MKQTLSVKCQNICCFILHVLLILIHNIYLGTLGIIHICQYLPMHIECTTLYIECTTLYVNISVRIITILWISNFFNVHGFLILYFSKEVQKCFNEIMLNTGMLEVANDIMPLLHSPLRFPQLQPNSCFSWILHLFYFCQLQILPQTRSVFNCQMGHKKMTRRCLILRPQ